MRPQLLPRLNQHVKPNGLETSSAGELSHREAAEPSNKPSRPDKHSLDAARPERRLRSSRARSAPWLTRRAQAHAAWTPHVYYYDVTRHEQNDFDRIYTKSQTLTHRRAYVCLNQFDHVDTTQHKTDQETKGGIFCSISSDLNRPRRIDRA